MKSLGVILVCLVAYSSTHLCLLSPPQRGSMMGINTQGADDCLRVKGPCGEQKMMSPAVGVRAGKNFTMTFQKNLDHWVKATPGYFTIAIGGSDTSTMKELSHIPDMGPDMGEPSLHLYTMNVTIPSDAIGMSTAVIQVSYMTKNPEAPAAFYQCSDVYVFKD